MHSLHALALRNLAARRLRTLFTGVAITLGVAAVFATSLLGKSAQARTAELARQGSRADLQITSREGETFDARLLDAVRAHPDVALASPEISYNTILLEPTGSPLILLGVDPAIYSEMEQLELKSGRYPTSERQGWILVPERWADEHDVRVGSRLTIPLDEDGAEPIQLRVVGVLKSRDDAGAALRDRTALVPLRTLQRMTGNRRQLERIRLALQPGRDGRSVEVALKTALADEYGSAIVVSPTGSGIGNTLYALMQGGLVLAGVVILMAAAFLIRNTFAMSVTERTREIGVLRSLGLDQGGVFRGVLVEAGILGLSGAMVGLPLGWGLAQAILTLLVMWQRFEVERLSLSVPGLVVAASVGVGVAVMAALLPARAAARVSPLAAIFPHREARPGRALGWTWPLGVLLWLGATGLALWAWLDPNVRTLEMRPMALLCVLVGLIALEGTLLLLPVWTAGLVALLQRALTRWGSMVGRLTGDQLAHQRQRTTLTAGALAVGLAAVVTLSGVLDVTVGIAENLVFGLMKDDFGLLAFAPERTLEQSDPITQPNLQEWPRDVLAAIDDVRNRAYVYSLSMTKPVDKLELAPSAGAYALDDVEALLRVGSFRYEQGNYETAMRILHQGQGVLIMPATARRLGLAVGDEIVLKTKRGRVPFRVAAVGGNPWFGTIMSRADAEQYFGVLPPLGYMITAKPGMDKDAIEERLKEGLEGRQGYMFFRIGQGSAVVDTVIGQPLRVLAMLLNGITVLALIIASLGQINTMTMSVIERVRELGVLRSVGMTRNQVRELVLLEAACVGVIGALIGGLAGMSGVLMYTLMWYTSAVEAMGFGSPTWASVSTSVGSALQGVAPIAALALVAAPLLTMLAAWSPAHMAAHLPIIEAIRHEAAALRRK